MLRVMSICLRTMTPINNDIGIETIEIIVERKLRKKIKIMITANKAPNRALSTIVLTDASIGSP